MIRVVNPLPVSDGVDRAAITIGRELVTFHLKFRTPEEFDQFKRTDWQDLKRTTVWMLDELNDTEADLYNGGAISLDKLWVQILAPETVSFYKGVTEHKTEIKKNWACTFTDRAPTTHPNKLDYVHCTPVFG